MVGAGEGREEPAGLQAAQRAEVDLLVAAERRVERRPPARERRRVEHDQVEAAPVALERAERVEGIGLEHLAARRLARGRVRVQVRRRPGAGGARAVEGEDGPGALPERPRGEGARVREGVQHRPTRGPPADLGAVLALIEVEAGLLAALEVQAEAARALADLDLGLAPPDEPAARVVESLDGRRRGVAAPVDGARARDLGAELGQPAGVGRHSPGQRLEDEDVAVAIEDQAREEIALAEDEADGVAVVAEAPAEGRRGLEPPAEEGVVDGLVPPRHEPAHDLGPGIVEAAAEEAAVRGRDGHRLAILPGAVEPRDVGAVDPGMPPANPRLPLGPKDEPRHGVRP